jgi:hypothetical protein
MQSKNSKSIVMPLFSSDLSPRLIGSVFSQRDVSSNLGRFEARRGMAENRFYPIKGASHETGITEEVRDLIRNVKHAENIEKVRTLYFIQNLQNQIYVHKH